MVAHPTSIHSIRNRRWQDTMANHCQSSRSGLSVTLAIWISAAILSGHLYRLEIHVDRQGDRKYLQLSRGFETAVQTARSASRTALRLSEASRGRFTSRSTHPILRARLSHADGSG